MLAYLPGIHGNFLLDDWSNLPVLGDHGGIVDLPTLLLYLSSGGGDLIGRPLTLLSFLIDDQTWPATATGFKRTGILIHLLNGALLCWAAYRLGLRAQYNERIAARAAILASLLWVGHPLLVSTTLYIVQRATLLAATFFLLAVLAWDQGWRALENQRRQHAWFFGFCLVALATVCATLSKANGALTPLLLSLIYWLFYRQHCRSLTSASLAAQSRIRLLSISLPSVAVILAIAAASADSFTQITGTRAWSLADRALSQPRVLLDYLGLLLAPREGSRGIFTDDFVVSLGLLSPPSTLTALLAILLLVYLTWRFRKSPPLALALGFFLLGHSLESGFINLELYYEHRNYLPALFLFWPISLWLLKPSENLRQPKLVFVILLPVVFSALTYLRASLWGSNEELARVSAYRNPASLRAQLYLSSVDIAARNYQNAEQRLQRAIHDHPAQPLLTFNLLHIQCLTGRDPSKALDQASIALHRTEAWDPGFYSWIADRIQGRSSGVCQQLRPEQLQPLIAALAANRNLLTSADAQQGIRALHGELALATGDWQTGTTWFTQSLDRKPSLEACLWLAYRQGDYGQPERGVHFLQANAACRLEHRASPWGITRLHLLLLHAYPAHDQLRADLESALTGQGLRGFQMTTVAPAQSLPEAK